MRNGYIVDILTPIDIQETIQTGVKIQDLRGRYLSRELSNTSV